MGSKGAWDGSDIHKDFIEHLRLRRKLPPTGAMEVRRPGVGSVLAPNSDEVGVFAEHFVRGFGLPASTFFGRFLTKFVLQPHHLRAKSILQLTVFVVLCEVFLGIEPLLDLWFRIFYLKKQTVEDKARTMNDMIACGAALVYTSHGDGYLKLPLQESVKHKQCSFFYVKNVDLAFECINLPPSSTGHRSCN
ncbi:hypothetical protein D1007_07996 [Hordeum vulgare]|nr:hypothetical protein D1007_07996 [Hordeum vulgare]